MGLCKQSNFLLLVSTLIISSGSNSALLESSTITSDYDINNQHTNDQNSVETLPEVTILQGVVKGLNLLTRKNRSIFGFTGIPFAKPPVGNLRFSNPVLADPWNGTFDASHESNKCPQFQDQIFLGDEDCLHINIYTPQLPMGEHPTLLPVMVFVHGGSFIEGSNDFNTQSPEYLLDKDILLVVPNYRLGVLGFFSTGDEESPGNYGLKDQVLALKWVRDNIEFFGGDPDQVTIVGQSAGGISITYLALSNSTIGLFHRYVSESGPAIGLAGYQPRSSAVEKALKLGQHFGCSTSNSAVLISCLRKLNASQIVDTVSLFNLWNRFPLITWGPTDEPDSEGAILIDTPANLLAAGKLRDVPCITGVARNEGLITSSYFYSKPDKFEYLLENIDDLLPYLLNYYNQVDDGTVYTAALREFYLNDLTINRSILLSNFTDLEGDGLFIFPTYEQLQRELPLRKSPSYFYSFEYRGTFSLTDLTIESMLDLGVAHADELQYLFPRAESKFRSIGKEMTETDLKMVDIMVELWTSFVINGIPTTSALSDTETWEPYSSRNNYLRIGNGADVSLEMQYSFHKERMDFWQKLTAAHNSIAFGISKNRAEDTSRDKPNVKLPELTIPQGTIRGMNLTTFRNKSISSFLGVPYAQPPTGNLRFKNPVESEAWNGTLDASNGQRVCPQLSENEVIGEEDCLYLNVYTPQIIPTDKTTTLLPVMVYIHGGGFDHGGGGPSHYSPEYLLDKEVLLVVPNYRLGVLGFLSTGDYVVPGNYGLKDMVLALKWVQKNIAYFGGDANQVTLFGQSSGASSVELLALSNTTNGLFHRCITESESAFSIRSFRPRKSYASRATELGGFLDCPTDSSTDLVDCLRKLNASTIVSTKSLFYVWETFPDIIWGPTDEPDTGEAFITESPTSLYTTGRIQDLPWITGVVRDEGLLLTSKFYANPDKFEEFLQKFDDVLPHVLQYHNVVNDEMAFTKALKAYYFNDLTADRSELLSNFTKLVGDAMFTYPIYSGLRQRLVWAESVEYFYSFQYRGTYSNSYKYSGGSSDNYGVAHADELLYLFTNARPELAKLGKEMSKTDYEMVDTMVQLWTSFAINGTPTASKLKGIRRWRPHSRGDNYLQIGDNAEVGLNVHYFFLSERMKFWKQFNDTMSNSEASVLSKFSSFLNDVLTYVEYIASSIYHWIVFWRE